MNATPPSILPAQRWAMAMGAILNERNHDDHGVLGGAKRPRHAARATQILAGGWDVRTPGEALDCLTTLFDTGHRTLFEADGLGSAESFAAWDWCRAANVAGWSFVAYLIDRETAWNALLRAARLVQTTYGSFGEMAESYLRGMRLWAGRDDDARVRGSEESVETLLGDPQGAYRLAWNTSLEGVPAPAIEQKVREVAPGGSILDAIVDVGSGGRVLLAPGVYAESITPPHSVEIAAAGEGEVVLEARDRPAVWAKSEVRDGHAHALSISLRGITLRAGRSADGKTLNAASVPGGYLRLHDCKVTATHHGASVRDGGWLLVSRSALEGCGQSGVWCEGGCVAVVDSTLADLGAHGAYVARSAQANVFEGTKIARAAQVGLFAEAELRVRACAIEAPGKYGVAVHAPVWVSRSTVAASRGWGVVVEKGAVLRMEATTIERSEGANLDVKDGRVDARECRLLGGATSGLVVQGKGRVLALDTRIEGHAQGNVYAIAGAQLFVAGGSIAGEASGLWLQDAAATVVDSRVASAMARAVDVRGAQAPVFHRCRVEGAIALDAGARARFAECELTGERSLGEGAALDVCTRAEIADAIDRAAARVQGIEEPPPAADLS